MDKKHWWTIAICSIVIFICGVLYFNYYQDYVAPESYTIGSYKPKDYTTLTIKDELTTEDVLFSQNLDDVSFKIDDTTGTAIYEYNASAIDFNGETNDYIIYVNEYMLSNLDESAGAISGTHNFVYYDVDKSVLATSKLNLSFASYTKALTFKLTLPSEDVGLLMRYFELNDFIVTLALNPYVSTDNLITEPTNQYNVAFMVDGNIIESQLVDFGTCASLPNYDTTGYGWSLDGTTIIDIADYPIIQHTTFTLIAGPAELYTITFNYATIGSVTASDGWSYSDGVGTKQVVAGEAIGALPAYSTSGSIVDYWYYLDANGEQVTVTTTSIMPSYNITIVPHFTDVDDGTSST